jgi:hypothetical protein
MMLAASERRMKRSRSLRSCAAARMSISTPRSGSPARTRSMARS